MENKKFTLVLDRKAPLSHKEKEVIQLLLDGHEPREIETAGGYSRGYVKAKLKQIQEKCKKNTGNDIANCSNALLFGEGGLRNFILQVPNYVIDE